MEKIYDSIINKISPLFNRVKSELNNILGLIDSLLSQHKKLVITSCVLLFVAVIWFWIWFIFFMPLVPSA